MRGFFLIRGLIRLIIAFGRSLQRGESWAYWTLLGIAGLAALAWFIWFAKRPLGGDPEKTPTDESQFHDAKNPYRDTL